MREAMGQHPRLARARTGEHQQRSVDRFGGARLIGIEPGEYATASRRRRGGRCRLAARLRRDAGLAPLRPRRRATRRLEQQRPLHRAIELTLGEQADHAVFPVIP
ncbi:MAG: hypothetical protein ACK4ST_15160, partial [Elioraea tepidiphila]